MAYIAIQTRFIGPTNHKGSRYAAWVIGRAKKRVVLSADYALGLDDNHYRAAMALADLWHKETGSMGKIHSAGGSDDARGNVYVVKV
jgi:hypothetical protein